MSRYIPPTVSRVEQHPRIVRGFDLCERLKYGPALVRDGAPKGAA